DLPPPIGSEEPPETTPLIWRPMYGQTREEKPEYLVFDPTAAVPDGPTRAVLERFRHIFAERDGPPGTTDAAIHRIEIDERAKTPKMRPRLRWSPAEKDFIEKEVDRMLAAGVVRLSKSPAAAQVVLAVKKGNKLRFCVDYRKLNLVTRTDAYPMPRP